MLWRGRLVVTESPPPKEPTADSGSLTTPEPRGSARATLERAKFFLGRAWVHGIEQPEVAEHYLNAAIVFGRSVTFHLQAEFSHRPDFDYWYAWQENILRQPLPKFFNAARTLIVHKRTIDTRQRKRTSRIVGELPQSVIVLPAANAPWYRHAWAKAMQPIYRLQQRWFFFQARRRAKRLPIEVTHIDLYFQDAEFCDTPAPELVRRYLKTLEAVVKSAESELGQTPDETGFPHLARRPRKECSK